ncbi:hypothetical protein C8R42DRAFT_686424 [Lentinula raphanica]|nr:hypothetical protein C8R42DRAFT_686424 [Lentinula raphanica]
MLRVTSSASNLLRVCTLCVSPSIAVEMGCSPYQRRSSYSRADCSINTGSTVRSSSSTKLPSSCPSSSRHLRSTQILAM